MNTVNTIVLFFATISQIVKGWGKLFFLPHNTWRMLVQHGWCASTGRICSLIILMPHDWLPLYWGADAYGTCMCGSWVCDSHFLVGWFSISMSYYSVPLIICGHRCSRRRLRACFPYSLRNANQKGDTRKEIPDEWVQLSEMHSQWTLLCIDSHLDKLPNQSIN